MEKYRNVFQAPRAVGDFRSRCFRPHFRLQAACKTLYKDSTEELAVIYQQATKVPFEDVSALLSRVGWPERRQKRMEVAIANSFYIATLEEHSETSERRLVGLARVVSDGALNAQLWDVIVDPDYQGIGLGKAMIGEVIQHLRGKGIGNITTFAEKQGSKFYEKLGFQIDPDGVRGMFLQDR